MATVPTQVGGCSSALIGSIRRLRRLSALRRFRAAQQLSNYSTLVSFQISKIFLISVAISDPESGPRCIFPLIALTKSDHRGTRDPMDFSVPVAYHSIVVVV